MRSAGTPAFSTGPHGRSTRNTWNGSPQRELTTNTLSGKLGADHSYDLARLARNGLIARIPHRNLYALTGDGLRFAVFYTKVHDRVLRPLMAVDQPPAPPTLRDALRVIDREVTRRLAAARLPAAA